MISQVKMGYDFILQQRLLAEELLRSNLFHHKDDGVG